MYQSNLGYILFVWCNDNTPVSTVSSFPLFIRNLPSGTRPLTTQPISFVMLYVLLSVPLSIILLMTIFSVPVTIPSEQTTPQIVLKKKFSDILLIEFVRKINQLLLTLKLQQPFQHIQLRNSFLLEKGKRIHNQTKQKL